MRTFITILLCLTATSLFSQSLSLIKPLGSNLVESSGMLYLNGKLITHTDSGGEPALYEIDTSTGLQNRKVYISNVTNIDWEDICSDQNFIYIGDFGNNQGNRTNLRIYKIALQDYWTLDTVQADTTTFNYSDQTNFSTATFTTNYDAEAIISLGDSLYIFTKNWGNGLSYIYPVSKNPGNYSLIKTDSINAQGLVTGAVCDSASKIITLIGYTLNDPFFIQVKQWNTLFSSGSITKNLLSPNSSIQIEGIAMIDSVQYFISSENFQTTVSELHVLDTRFPANLNYTSVNDNYKIYPNPTSSMINIPHLNTEITTSLYDLNGREIIRTKNKTIPIQDLSSGIYLIELKKKNSVIHREKLLISE